MQENSASQNHTLSIENRESLVLTGITDVPTFDEETVNLRTSLGSLVIKGEALHISRLSLETGEVIIDGRINSLQYLGEVRQKGIMSKLFR